ncbi:MAG: hypothetical protein JSW58_08315 [Candidatus Latescibacterota bacterium]|nr:MAG: hypothetical protein JSW58_08315 [Candidatus Latescibacterota bacterium]
MRTKVLVSFPTPPKFPYLHKKVVFVSWRILADRRYEIEPMIPTKAPFENNLHHILNDFMTSDCTFWLSVDADNPPIGKPLDLVEEDLDLVGYPTPVWHFDPESPVPGDRPFYWNAYDYVPEEDAYAEHDPKDGLQRVDAIGTGCFLVHRRVFEHPEMRKAPFQRTYYDDGTVKKGNDLAFSERVRRCGFSIYAHYGYPCSHYVELDINEAAAGFRNSHVKVSTER